VGVQLVVPVSALAKNLDQCVRRFHLGPVLKFEPPLGDRLQQGGFARKGAPDMQQR
jgi:hypothetical protein